MRESELERRLVDEIEGLGGKAFKFISPGNNGVPDRLILIDGCTCFAEIKAPGKKLRPLQEHRKKQFEKLGFRVFVVNSVESLKETVNDIKNRR